MSKYNNDYFTDEEIDDYIARGLINTEIPELLKEIEKKYGIETKPTKTLKTKEAAAYLGIKVIDLKKKCIPYFRIGKNRYYRTTTLDEYKEKLNNDK